MKQKRSSFRYLIIACLLVSASCITIGGAAMVPPATSETAAPHFCFQQEKCEPLAMAIYKDDLSVGYGLSILDNAPLDVIYYNQCDPEYADLPYGTDKIGTHGCGPTAMAMVVSTLTKNPMDPAEMAQWAYENGYWYPDKGSLHALIPDAAAAWGLNAVGCTAEEVDKIQAALNQKKLVVALMGKGHFTKSGHFIVLSGINEDGQVLVADPASRERSKISWDFDLIMKEAAQNAGAGGPFWIIGY